MPMPETAMDEDRQPMFGKDEIRPSGQILAMEPETQPDAVCGATHAQLRTGVLAPNPRHIGAAPHRVELIDHRQSVRAGSGATSFPA